MSFTIKTWNGNQKQGTFYIQSKGLHAGRPMYTPIKNCFVIYTEDTLLYSRVYSLYIGKFFAYYIIGSVIPFIRVDDVKRLITQAQQLPEFTKELSAVAKIDELLTNLTAQIQHYRHLQRALCSKVNQAIILQ